MCGVDIRVIFSRMKLVLLFICLLICMIEGDYQCVCPLHFAPVCGSDGVTYGNMFCMICLDENLSVAHKGPCKGSAYIAVMTNDYENNYY